MASRETTEQIKDMMDSVYEVIANLDARGLGKHITGCEEDGLKGLVQADMLLFIVRSANPKETISDECLEYINTCLGYNLTTLTFEIARKKALDTELPELCMALPFFVLIDKHIGGNRLSTVYVQAASYVTLGYIQLEEHTTLEEMVAYYRLSQGCIDLIENALGKKVEFDPLERLKDDQAKLIRTAVEIDRMIHKKNPVVEALEKAVVKALADADTDSDTKEEPEKELFKDPGDGSDLEDEATVDIIKDQGDGSDLEDEVIAVDGAIPFSQKKAPQSAMDKLNALIGLQDVKKQVNTMLNVLRVRQRCDELNVKRPAISLHMVFTGNPGTGKTTVARILGEVYKEFGMLSKGHFVEVSRVDLVGKYVGHTAVMVKEVFEKAKGGVLFIDEAYALTSEGDSFGQEAVETLIKLMEDNRDDIAVVIAGYPALMQGFLDSNPGLRSRFPFVVEFPDYTGEELTQIFKIFCKENDIKPTKTVLEAVERYFDAEAAKKNRTYGNARAVRNFFEKMIMNQANRLIADNTLDRADLCKFVMNDIPRKTVLKPMMLPKGGLSVVK